MDYATEIGIFIQEIDRKTMGNFVNITPAKSVNFAPVSL